MKQSNIIIILIIFLAAAIIAAFMFVDKKDTPVMIVNVTLASSTDNDPTHIISQVDAVMALEKKMAIPEETSLNAPGITVMVIQNMQEKSGWISVPIPSKTSIYGKYTLTVKQTNPIDQNQPVRILSRVIDPLGKEITVKASDIMIK